MGAERLDYQTLNFETSTQPSILDDISDSITSYFQLVRLCARLAMRGICIYLEFSKSFTPRGLSPRDIMSPQINMFIVQRLWRVLSHSCGHVPWRRLTIGLDA